MKITNITIKRLYNLGNYEHVAYSLNLEIPEGESVAVALIGAEKILSALNPKRPSSITSEEEISRAQFRLDEMRKLSDADFEQQHGGYKGSREEYTQRIQDGIIEDSNLRKAWESQAQTARKLLDDLGGAANWKDAKLDWEDSF